LKYFEVLVDEAAVLRSIGKQTQLALVMKRKIRGDPAKLSPGEDQVKLLIVGDEARHESVGGFDRRDVPQSKLLHEAILKRQMRPLDPPLGRRRVRANPVNIELIEEDP